MFLLDVAIKIKIFTRTRIVRVALVSHLSRSCSTHVAHVSLVSLVSGTRVVN